ncbi:response regulator transcription factor [Amycolatopsis sp. CA-126428]|uniref:response regulator transcription factor n=1 Tax=Amycolatopsis sp. CA-126428 TaxID=2073158 RepID=UPI000CD04254|nr:response regulator transcription factor [Amycolatopsis sp. CA-126428]
MTIRVLVCEDHELVRAGYVTVFGAQPDYEALRAGASGFLLKDSPVIELVNGIRTVARGESLLAPAVTRNRIGRFASRVRPAATEPDGQALAVLSPRKREVLRLIAAGLANTEIAEELGLGFETVKTCVSGILAKLDLRDRVQAVVFAYRTGFAPSAEP